VSKLGKRPIPRRTKSAGPFDPKVVKYVVADDEGHEHGYTYAAAATDTKHHTFAISACKDACPNRTEIETILITKDGGKCIIDKVRQPIRMRSKSGKFNLPCDVEKKERCLGLEDSDCPWWYKQGKKMFLKPELPSGASCSCENGMVKKMKTEFRRYTITVEAV